MVPEVVSTNFHLRQGDKIADFGAGKGYFMKTLSNFVGPEGRVYACEIQKGMVEAITDLAQSERLGNVEPIWCDLEALNGTKLDDGILDVGILVNTLFILEDKDTAIEEMKRTLRSGGKLFVIDWTESFGGLGPHPTQVVDEDTAKDIFEAHGFVFERDFDAGDHHYGLAFRRA